MHTPVVTSLLRAIVLVIGAMLAAGCGGAKAPEAPADVSTSPSEPIGEIPELFYAVDDDVNVLLTADWSAVVEELVEPLSQVLKMTMPPAAEEFSKLEEACGFQPWASADRLVFFGRFGEKGGSGKTDWGVLVVEPTVPMKEAVDCVVNLTEGSVRNDGWIRSESAWGKQHGKLLLLGSDKPHVERALARLDRRHPPQERVVHIAESGILALSAHELPGDEFSEIHVVLADRREPGLSRVRVVFPDAGRAAEAEEQAHGWLAQASSMPVAPEAKGGLERLVSSVEIERSDVVLDLSVHVPAAATLPEYRVAMIGVGAALAIYGVRRYIIVAKTREARSNVGAIAKALATHVGSTFDGKRLLLPPSAPRVPAEVPQSEKYQSVSSDWRGTWQKLGFRLTDPQYYSYEIETSPDRRSAVVRATGDLDGDGTLSRFELELKIVKEEDYEVIHIVPELREVEPEE